jgi:ketosteroid isomerase-like protein
MTNNTQVIAASTRFYAALNAMANGNSDPMDGIWLTGDRATAQHPIGGRDCGYDDVTASFKKVSEIARGGNIRLTDQQIDVGAEFAVETGIEVGTLNIEGHIATLNHRVTNVYRQSGGTWKLQLHHADISTELLDILKKIQPAG